MKNLLMLIVVLAGCAPTPREPGEEAREDAASTPEPRQRIDASDGAAALAAPTPTPRDAGADRNADGAAVVVADARAPAAPPVTEQQVVAVLWIEVDRKPISADAKTPGRLKVIDEPGNHQNLASRAGPTIPIGIALRGNYSRGLPKKPYALELQDGAGAEKAAPLLGLPAESDWVLNASYTDHTFLRNPLTYGLAQEMGRYASRFRFVEVYLDGVYQGLYILLEKPNRDAQRVNIPRPAASATEGDLSGGYIFRLEGPGKGGARDWRSAAGTIWTYGYPKFDVITPEQKTYLQGFVNRFETLMASAGYADRAKGYPSVIDVPSFVDYALVQELAMNYDAYWKSHRLHKQPDARGGKLFAGPIWDFDNAYGMAEFASWTNGRLHINMPKFWSQLWADPSFLRDLKCRWTELRASGPFTMQNIDAKLGRWAKLIEEAQRRENARWQLIGAKVPVVKFVGPTYDSYVQYLRSWIVERIAWLDRDYARLPGTCDGAALPPAMPRPVSPPPLAGTPINDADPAVRYVGAKWAYSSQRNLGDHLDDVHHTTGNGDHAELAFTGTAVQVIMGLANDQGQVDVSVDGVFDRTIDTFVAGPRVPQQIVYHRDGLAPGAHTIRVTKKSGPYMLVDAFRFK